MSNTSDASKPGWPDPGSFAMTPQWNGKPIETVPSKSELLKKIAELESNPDYLDVLKELTPEDLKIIKTLRPEDLKNVGDETVKKAGRSRQRRRRGGKRINSLSRRRRRR
jgi:hypothetical protein